MSFSYAQNKPKKIGLALLAVMTGMVGTWLGLGQYADAPLIWFLVGALAHSNQPVRATDYGVNMHPESAIAR
jgi:hypothetical protein